jgi:xylulokinase
MTRWYRDTLYFDALAQQELGGRNAYEAMLDHMNQIPAGSDGLITLPYFAGERTPINDPNASGVIFGLKLAHTRDHLYKSALEGVGFGIAQLLDIMKEHQLPLKKIMAVGGGAKNLPWLQIIADITGETLNCSSVTMGAAFGDALMAALAVGRFQSFADFDEVIKPGRITRPNMKTHLSYQPYRKIFDQLYLATKDMMHSL